MSGRAQPPPLSEAQMEIMEVVWGRGTATVGAIWKALQERRSVARNTVQTMVTRLEEKGWLRHRDEGGVFQFEAVHPRAAAVRGLVRRLVDTAFQGSVAGLVMSLLDEQQLSPEERTRLRTLIEQAEARRGKTPTSTGVRRDRRAKP
jgi:predicted transcriptional regulator